MIDTDFSEKCADANNSGNYDPFSPSNRPAYEGLEPVYVEADEEEDSEFVVVEYK
jgi:hypothetical protein